MVNDALTATVQRVDVARLRLVLAQDRGLDAGQCLTQMVLLCSTHALCHRPLKSNWTSARVLWLHCCRVFRCAERRTAPTASYLGRVRRQGLLSRSLSLPPPPLPPPSSLFSLTLWRGFTLVWRKACALLQHGAGVHVPGESPLSVSVTSV